MKPICMIIQLCGNTKKMRRSFMSYSLNRFKKTIALFTLSILFACEGYATDGEDNIEILSLDIISYEDFVQGDATALDVLKNALYEKGIVGIKGVPGYKEKVLKFIESAR